MPKRKYDWPQLKKDFMAGDWLTVTQFLRDKDMPQPDKSSHISRKTRGWGKEKKKRREEALDKAIDRSVKKEFEGIEERRVQQARIARWMQKVGVEEAKGMEARNLDEARKMITSGLREERKALGVEGRTFGKGSQQMTQVNINLPKTRFDDQLEDMNYGELVEFVAEIKRARAGRDVREGVVSGEEEASEE